MIKAIKRHPKRALFIVFLLILIFVVIILSNLAQTFFDITMITTKTSEETQQIFIFGISIDNYFTFLSIFGLIVGAIWGLIQYDKTVKLRQQEKATEIAKSFAEKLTTKCTIICSVLENSTLSDLIDFKGKDCFSFSNFNTSEIRDIYQDDDFISKYKKAKKEANLDVVYYNILENLISTKTYEEIKKEHTSYTDEEIKNLFILNNSDLPFLFTTLVYDVLNELEYQCMYLSSQVAGSKYVYQSLHQVFLRTIRALAIQISIANNTSYSDKYYTNIISVYNEWKNLYADDLKNEKEVKKKVDQILNPKIKTV